MHDRNECLGIGDELPGFFVIELDEVQVIGPLARFEKPIEYGCDPAIDHLRLGQFAMDSGARACITALAA